MKIKPTLTVITTILGLTPAFAGEPNAPAPAAQDADKSHYHLFNPTPDAMMRELSPDRPDTTESPITLDAGHYAVELSLFDWRRDGSDDTYTLLATNLKVGLTSDTDLQFVFDAYTWEDPAAGGGAEGFGDVQLRLKHNLWGNDGGDSALAVFPFVKIPTGTALSNGEWEGGLILPFSTQLAERVGLGLMAEFDSVYDEDSREHEFEFLFTAVLGIDLTDRLGAFVEFIGITGNTPYQTYGAGGLTYTIHDDLVLDCGAQAGLNGAAEDFGAFAGFTRRF